ncbi:unnamed protein product [Ambrosiozyma monospora]|uniref:Unnamed protein product n=1 Tax=Ambrosiozyma monospora TaxID=43982 RepID=A0A9W6Z0Z9_AMBMO|nr:unnamed protein product [Ambrosiozyma monospora]
MVESSIRDSLAASNLSSLKPEFEINYPTPAKTFSPQFPHVTGTVDIVDLSFILNFQDVESIQIGLRGTANLVYRHVHIDSDEQKRITTDCLQKHSLFDENQTIFTKEQFNSLDVAELFQFAKPEFNVSFPKEKLGYLPSSVYQLGRPSHESISW